MNRWNLRLRREPISFWFTENQKKGVNAAHGCFLRIVKLRVLVAILLELLHALACARAQIIQSAKDDRFGGTHFCAGGYESALLSIVTERALERASCIRKRLGPAIDHAEGARDDAVAAAVADVILHQNRPNFRAHDRACWARFEAAGFLAMFANV